MRPTTRLLLLLASLSLAGCGGDEPPDPGRPRPDRPTDPGPAADPTAPGRIAGRVVLRGPPPVRQPVAMGDPDCVRLHAEDLLDESVIVGPDGGLAGCFVWLVAGPRRPAGPAPTEPVRVVQVGCRFEPRVVGLRAGQPLEIENLDKVLHNVHATTDLNDSFNETQLRGDVSRVAFAHPETMIHLECHLHRWMEAWIGVVDHPHFAVTGPDGAFVLPDVAPGRHRLAVWHEVHGRREVEVDVAPGATAGVEIEVGGG